MAAKSTQNIVLGAMTFGREGAEMVRVSDPKVVGEIVDIFTKHGHSEIDTARVYGGGSSEEMLKTIGWQERGLIMETKLYPTPSNSDKFKNAEGISHSDADIKLHLQRSLEALGCDKIDMFYMHGPDRSTSYEQTFATLDALHKEGKFKRLGISNYMAWEVAQICELCKQNGWIQPTVYQGIYNGVHRLVEAELFPCLRKYGMSFYAFNPLAGGFFTGALKRDAEVEKGSRFDSSTTQGKMYRKRYWNDTYFDALEKLQSVVEKSGLTMGEVALRWISHHSMLSKEKGDAILIGASSVKHIDQNLLDLEKEPLPENVREAVDEAWASAKGIAPNYFH